MSTTEAFRIRLFAPGAHIPAAKVVLQIANAMEKVLAIIRPFVRLHRISFVAPVDGTGWLVVLIQQDTQMSLDFEIAKRCAGSPHEEAESVADAFRSHCQNLISVIRRARLDRQGLDDLHREAVACHKSLIGLALAGDGAPMSMQFSQPGAELWSPSIPCPPAYMRAKDQELTLAFDVESVGHHFAKVKLDRPSREIIFSNQSRTMLLWKPLEQPVNTSTYLHRRMLRRAVVQAHCLPILRKNGQLHGLALRSLVK